ncbi:MAG: type II toxin-antitoxin system RelE/ParE family toxin, partial [Gallionellaceae bacterium]|nr:type II toxin-antitoxin system RelE/ParE family toxin [Gallionellaceae bacterium]
MLPIIWRASARDDLRRIIRHIASDNPPAASRMKNLLEAAVMPASTYPYIGHLSDRIPGLRE